MEKKTLLYLLLLFTMINSSCWHLPQLLRTPSSPQIMAEVSSLPQVQLLAQVTASESTHQVKIPLAAYPFGKLQGISLANFSNISTSSQLPRTQSPCLSSPKISTTSRVSTAPSQAAPETTLLSASRTPNFPKPSLPWQLSQEHCHWLIETQLKLEPSPERSSHPWQLQSEQPCLFIPMNFVIQDKR